MTPIAKKARIAGSWYLLLCIIGPIRLLYIPSKLFVTGNATATADNILAHEGLFRLGFTADLIGCVVLIFLTVALYDLFKEVDQKLAVLVVLLGGVLPSAIYFLNVMNDIAALTLIRGADFLSAFDKPQRDALARLLLNLHYREFLAGEMFYGAWLFPLGLLTYRSRFVPRFLGVWLILAGFAYLAQCFTGLLLPRYEDTVGNVAFPFFTGEIAFMLWILIMGAKERAAPAQSAARA